MCVIEPIKDSPHIWLATCWQTGLMLGQFWANLVCYVKWLITCWHLVYLVGPMKLGQRCANCWARRWPDEKHGVGPISSASDGSM